MKSVCVFCGSHAGRGETYRAAARGFGEELARRGLTLVYGGAHVGLMGIVADAVMSNGGRAIGVIPRFLLEREVGHGGLSELHVVESMHERKAKMAEVSEAFVALPGGIGTLEEIFEVWTWVLLGLHNKPVGLLQVGGYFDPLLAYLDRTVEEGFVSAAHGERELAVAVEDALARDGRVEEAVGLDGAVKQPLARDVLDGVVAGVAALERVLPDDFVTHGLRSCISGASARAVDSRWVAAGAQTPKRHNLTCP